jgi:heme/copper-type cytochrome/quinol oxidase subunit 4
MKKSPLAGDFSFLVQYCNIAKKTMGHNIKSIKEACALARRVWREASVFLLSIELWLVAVATVSGVFFAFMGSPLSILAFGFAGAYVAMRSVLHAKRILNWPFI